MFTQTERFFASTPPGREWVPLLLIAGLLLAAVYLDQPRRK